MPKVRGHVKDINYENKLEMMLCQTDEPLKCTMKGVHVF